MAQVVGGVSVDLTADAGIIVREMERAARSVDQSARKMATNTNQFATGFRGLEGRVKQSAAGISNAFYAMRAAIAAVAAAQAVRQIIGLADSMKQLQARVSLVHPNLAVSAEALRDISAIAQETRQPLQQTAELYTKIGQASTELAGNQERLAGIVKALSNALIVGGSSGASASAALNQLSQSISTGILRAEEFNSISEQTPAIARAMATGLGITTGELRQLVIKGLVPTESALLAVESQMDELAAQASKLPTTVGQAVTQLNNTFMELVGSLDQSLGASSALAGAMQELNKFVRENQESIAAFGQAMTQNLQGAIDLVQSTIEFFRQLGDAIRGAIGSTDVDKNIERTLGRLQAVKEFASDIGGGIRSALGFETNVEALGAQAGNLKQSADAIAESAASAADLSKTTQSAADAAADLALEQERVRIQTDLAALSGGNLKETIEATASAASKAVTGPAVPALVSPTGAAVTSAALPAVPVQAEPLVSPAEEATLTRVEAKFAEVKQSIVDAGTALKESIGNFDFLPGVEALFPVSEHVKQFAPALSEADKFMQKLADSSRETGRSVETINAHVDQMFVGSGALEQSAALATESQKSATAVEHELNSRIAMSQVPPPRAAPPPSAGRAGPDPSIQAGDRTAQADAAFAKKLQDDLNEATYEAYRFESAIGDAMGAMILEGADAGDTMQALARRIRDMVIEMLIIMPIAQALGRALQGAFAGGAPIGGLLFGGFRQHGGSTQGGKAYVVGEKGPELWMDNRSGFVVSNDNLKRLQSGSGGNSVNIGSINQDNRGATAEMAQVARRAAWDMIPAIQQAVAQKAGHDPKYRKALRGRG